MKLRLLCGFCVYECVHVYRYMVCFGECIEGCMYVGMCTWEGQTSTSGVIPQVADGFLTR